MRNPSPEDRLASLSANPTPKIGPLAREVLVRVREPLRPAAHQRRLDRSRIRSSNSARSIRVALPASISAMRR